MIKTIIKDEKFGMDIGVTYNEKTDEITIAYVDGNGKMLEGFEDDCFVMYREMFLRMWSSFKQAMLNSGYGSKIKGY